MRAPKSCNRSAFSENLRFTTRTKRVIIKESMEAERRAAAVEERAWFEQVYRQNVDLLFRVGRRLLDSDENPDTLYDMVQEIFLLLWDRRETLKTHPNIGGWLMAALKFRILGERGRVTRRALRHAYSLDDDGAAPVSDRALSPEERAVFAGHVQAIRRLLKPDMAELFIDYAVNGCTTQQLAQKNGLTVSCVWMRLNRCKRRLREHPEFFYLFLLIVLGNGGHTV